MRDDVAILTIPISPPKTEKAGIFSLCTVMDILRSKTGGAGHVCMNYADGYTDRHDAGERFLSAINKIDLGADVWKDTEHRDHIPKNTALLLAQGHLQIKEVTSLVCDCGRLDCKEDSLEHIQNSKIFREEDGDIICNSCNTAGTAITERAIVLHVPPIDLKAKTVPAYLKKDMEELHKQFQNQEIMISKRRDTGVTFDHNGERFNLDIDFCSFNYLSAFPATKKVVVATSHVTYQMYMINLMNRLCNPEDDVVFLPIAHIQGESGLNVNDSPLDGQRKKLFLAAAFNLAKDTKWPTGELRYATNKPAQLLNMIADKLGAPSPQTDDENWHQYIERLARKEMNFAKIKQEQTQKFKSLQQK